jgi:hypothetical protein
MSAATASMASADRIPRIQPGLLGDELSWSLASARLCGNSSGDLPHRFELKSKSWHRLHPIAFGAVKNSGCHLNGPLCLICRRPRRRYQIEPSESTELDV